MCRNIRLTEQEMLLEDRTDSAWRSKVTDVLCAAAGHTIKICDAFKMDKFDAQLPNLMTNSGQATVGLGQTEWSTQSVKRCSLRTCASLTR